MNIETVERVNVLKFFHKSGVSWLTKVNIYDLIHKFSYGIMDRFMDKHKDKPKDKLYSLT